MEPKHRIIDFHSHILPGVDDGSGGVQESLAMLNLEAEQGIRHVVATPHFYAQHDTPEAFLERRESAVRQLQSIMGGQAGLPELSVGAEVSYFPGIGQCDILQSLAIDGKFGILVEMPMCSWTDRMLRDLEDIREKQDLIPVIAHVDRYLRPFRSNQLFRQLEKLPVLVQANAEFFLNPRTRSAAIKLLQQDRIHLLGSDCHNLTSRSPNLGAAVECIRRSCGQEILHRIHLYQDTVL